VTVQVSDSKERLLGNVTTDSSGGFHFDAGLLSRDKAEGYSISIRKAGFKPVSESLGLPSDSHGLSFFLESDQELVIKVVSSRKSGPGVSPSGANDYALTNKDVEEIPRGLQRAHGRHRDHDAGVSSDQNQQYHVRQTYTLQLEVNGILLPLDMYGQPSFISLINPLFIKRVDLLTGVLPAQYGFANSGGVLSVQTKDGSENGGSVTTFFGQRGTLQPSVQYGGTSGKFSYYLNGIYDQGTPLSARRPPGPTPSTTRPSRSRASASFPTSSTTP